MTFTTIFIIAGVVLLVIFFLIAKLAIRWAISVAIVGIILVALLGAGGFWWWSNRLAARLKAYAGNPPRRADEVLLVKPHRSWGKRDTDDAADPLEPELLVRQRGMPGLWRRYRRLPRNVFAISLVSLLNDASSEIIYPLLPVFLNH